MKYPLTLSAYVTLLSEGQPHLWLAVESQGEDTPIRIKIELDLPALDSPENLQDFARQALAAACEAL
jgi:hypothetical protein